MNSTMTKAPTDKNCTADANCCQEEVRTYRPKADVFQNDDGWFITMDLPGADESTTDISLEKDVLTIKASSEDHTPEGFKPLYTEFSSRRFERAFRLPDDVDRSSIDATVKNGVLHVKLSKSPETRPQKVVVKGG